MMTESDNSPESLVVQLQLPTLEWVDVGIIRSDQSYTEFRFFQDYFEIPERPLLGYAFEFVQRDRVFRSKVSLPRWFSHLLPEGRLRAAVADAAEVATVREFDLIRRLGASDLPGAVRVVPIGDRETEQGDRLILEEEEDSFEVDPVLKFSLAGAQMKFSVSREDAGLTIPVAGTAGDFILKLPDERPGFSSVPQSENSAMNFARRVGIDTAATSLVSTREVQGLGRWAESEDVALLVERFDRVPRGRIHAEEFAQVLNIPVRPEAAKYKSANYESVVSLALSLVGESAAFEAIRRIVFSALIGNGDAHLKNWGLRYPDGQNPLLSPACDVLSTVAYIPDDSFGLNLGKNKDFAAISLTSFDQMVSKVGLGGRAVRAVVEETVSRVRDGWADYLEEFSPTHRQRLEVHFNRMPLARLR